MAKIEYSFGRYAVIQKEDIYSIHRCFLFSVGDPCLIPRYEIQFLLESGVVEIFSSIISTMIEHKYLSYYFP